jgi:hypothetical protein
MEMYSNRGRQFDNYRYDVPDDVRRRIVVAIHNFPRNGEVLSAVANALVGQYGGLMGLDIVPKVPPAIAHFLTCDDRHALDFLEVFFRCAPTSSEGLVDEFNTIFREHGVGYELTPLTSQTVKNGGLLFGRKAPSIEVTYPKVQRLDNMVCHQEMIECLTLLGGADYKTANDEFLKAHDHYRHGRLDEALAYCCSSFESVMKTVLAKKGITPKPNATAAPLVKECITAGIIPAFYEGCFVAVATIRNALSDAAHGKGPGPKVPIKRRQVEHLLHLAATNIVLLVNSV